MPRLAVQLLCIMLTLLPVTLRAAEIPEESMSDPDVVLALVREVLPDDQRLAGADLRIDSVRQGLAASHYRYSQWFGGARVFGAELLVSVGNDGAILRHYVNLADPPLEVRRRRDLIEKVRQRHPEIVGRIADRVSTLSNRAGVAHPVERIVIEDAPHRFSTWEVDAVTGAVLSKTPMYISSSGRVFPANPVTILNDSSLRDGEDAAGVVPLAAYEDVELLDLPAAGELSGPNVTIVDIDLPTTVRAKVEEGLIFERDRDQFEEVNVYHHIDRSQRYLQSLGYTGNRQIVPDGIRVDVHANRGADNSFFSSTPSGARILFGDGGVDDAEDADIILHEYGHAIHDSLSPGVLFGSSGSEGRAVSEGFGDYWAFSEGFGPSIASGRDPFCVGDWDARCDGGSCAYSAEADCLRRVDDELMISDFIRSTSPGTEHQNGRIWSTFLRDLFMTLVARYGVEEGRQRTDTIVLESLQGLPANPGFDLIVSGMIDADQALYGSADVRTICTGARARGFTVPPVCRAEQRGQTVVVPGADPVTLSPEASVSRQAILSSDGEIRGVMVRVELGAEAPAQLQISLVAPDATRVILKAFGSETPATMVFGRDRLPDQPLESLSGRSNPGLWTLQFELGPDGDPLIVRDWAIYFEIESGERIDSRVPLEGSRFIPAAAHTAGAERTFFVTDLAISHPGPSHDVVVIYTPAGADGTVVFSAVHLSLPANGSIVLNDVVDSVFDATGTGSLELRGALPGVRISSRTYNRGLSGTFGQTIPQVGATVDHGERGLLSQVRRTVRYRTNIGIVDVSGRGSEAVINVRDSEGNLVGMATVGVEPFALRQVSLGSFVTVTDVDGAWAEVSVLNPDDAISAYSSVVDNLTGDSVFVPVSIEPSSPRASAIPAVARVPGAAGTRWRSDLWIVNGTDEQQDAELRFHGTDGSIATRQVSLDSGSSRLYEDVIGGLFETEGTGSIRISSSRLTLSSRTWNDDPGGSYGQYIGSVDLETALAAGETGIVPKVIITSDYRSNIGLTELTGSAVSARIDVRDGGGVLRCSLPTLIGPNQHRQWSVAALGCEPIGGGRVEIHHLGGDGRIAGYVSIVDQKSGDPSFIPIE